MFIHFFLKRLITPFFPEAYFPVLLMNPELVVDKGCGLVVMKKALGKIEIIQVPSRNFIHSNFIHKYSLN